MRGSNHREHLIRLQQAYDRRARERDNHPKENWKMAERQRFLSYLWDRGASSLLEIGAGTGHDSRFFADHGLGVTATDASAAMVEMCRAKNLVAYQRDFYELDFADERFDAVWALNCLLHVAKADLPSVLGGISGILKGEGLFYLGLYGGQDSEGIWDKDTYKPQRFFSFHTDAAIQIAVREKFILLDFHRVDYGHPTLHFQLMVLQKREDL